MMKRDNPWSAWEYDRWRLETPGDHHRLDCPAWEGEECRCETMAADMESELAEMLWEAEREDL